MSRIPIAIVLFLIGITMYVTAALDIADHLESYHWAIQAVYFLFAGLLWTVPTRQLMLWAAHR
jgi:hypothetical protein